MEELTKEEQFNVLLAFHQQASEYISTQQSRIEELTKHLMIVESKNNILQKEIEQLVIINKQYKEKEEREKFQRMSAKDLSSSKPREEPKPEVVQTKYKTVKGFNLKEGRKLK